MRGAPSDLRVLVEQCLDDDPVRRPPISDVSERMRRMKQAENVRCPEVTMNPITWQVEQVTEKLGQLVKSTTAKVQVIVQFKHHCYYHGYSNQWIFKTFSVIQ